LPLADGLIDERNVAALGGRDHAAAVLLLELRNAGGVVGMMMRDQNVGQPPSGHLERLRDRRRFRRIDGGGCSACRIVQQHTEIVLEAEKQSQAAAYCSRRELTGRQARALSILMESEWGPSFLV